MGLATWLREKALSSKLTAVLCAPTMIESAVWQEKLHAGTTPLPVVVGEAAA